MDSLKRDIKYAVLIALAASIFGLIVNTVRTPVLTAMEKAGKLHATQVKDYKGLQLIDDWSHEGRPKSAEAIEEPGSDETGETQSGGPIDAEPRLRHIQLPTAQSLYESGDAVFFDARILSEYASGHIAGAKPWPFDEFLKYLEIYSDGISYGTQRVVYCEGGDCDQSEELTEDLLIEGYLKIDIYTGGYDEWMVMGMPTETGVPE
jgi:rhodanese-related sulfurtransferase